MAWYARKYCSRAPQQHFKKLEGAEEIREVRVDFGGETFRFLGFWDEGQLIILTNAFAKRRWRPELGWSCGRLRVGKGEVNLRPEAERSCGAASPGYRLAR